ncbi:hypothetical protein Xoosp13_61 [Xanthomonas phage Xoo-sp13]|nr:hypothetical protein Xoosp13_61 [Xanthomonas phage Xoo-sp13]
MSNIANISNQIAKLSRQLTDARANGDAELAEQLEDALNDLEDALSDAEEDARGTGYGWS